MPFLPIGRSFTSMRTGHIIVPLDNYLLVLTLYNSLLVFFLGNSLLWLIGLVTCGVMSKRENGRYSENLNKSFTLENHLHH